jgi:hypothetical protein
VRAERRGHGRRDCVTPSQGYWIQFELVFLENIFKNVQEDISRTVLENDWQLFN